MFGSWNVGQVDFLTGRPSWPHIWIEAGARSRDAPGTQIITLRLWALKPLLYTQHSLGHKGAEAHRDVGGRDLLLLEGAAPGRLAPAGALGDVKVTGRAPMG